MIVRLLVNQVGPVSGSLMNPSKRSVCVYVTSDQVLACCGTSIQMTATVHAMSLSAFTTNLMSTVSFTGGHDCALAAGESEAGGTSIRVLKLSRTQYCIHKFSTDRGGNQTKSAYDKNIIHNFHRA
jgi:hypothetical protein